MSATISDAADASRRAVELDATRLRDQIPESGTRLVVELEAEVAGTTYPLTVELKLARP